MTLERHPDIEIYLKRQSLADIRNWLTQRFEHCETRPQPGKKTHTLQLRHQGQLIPVLIVEGASGAYTSVWFDSAHTPWATDLECARDAQAALGGEVRCSIGGWSEGEDPDTWWSVSEHGEQQVVWQG